MPNKSVLPFGVVTLSLVAMTLAYNMWNDTGCDDLESQLNQGYFLRWAEPQLLLITANKESILIEADNKNSACQAMLKQLNIKRTQPTQNK